MKQKRYSGLEKILLAEMNCMAEILKTDFLPTYLAEDLEEIRSRCVRLALKIYDEGGEIENV